MNGVTGDTVNEKERSPLKSHLLLGIIICGGVGENHSGVWSLAYLVDRGRLVHRRNPFVP